MIKVNTKVNVRNEYELTLKKPDGSEVVYKSHNMVLDNYYDYIITNNAAPSLSVIRIGQGTGAVDASQTTLGNLRASYSASTTDQTTAVPVSRVLTYTIPEGTLTGNISEIGLTNSTSGTTVYTRSLVQDAEGNPIVIDKGALDILTVRVTVYYTFEGTAEYPYVVYVNKINASAALMQGGKILDTRIFFFTCRINEYIANNLGDLTNLAQISTSTTRVSDLPNKTIRANGSVILAADGNGSMTVPEWAARMIGNSKFMIDVEDSGVFTPYVYNNLPVGTGDGITTAFDMPLVFYYPEDVEIFVDGVLLDPSEYTVISQSISRSLRTLPSADLTKVFEASSVGALVAVGTGGDAVNMLQAGLNYVCYDFEEPILVTHFFLKTLPKVGISGGPWAEQVYLFKSDNGIDWEQIYYNALGQINTTLNVYDLPTPATARYYKIQWNQTFTTQSTGYDPNIAFGQNIKSITFNTPPADGLPIVAKVTSRVPIKNSNFQLGASIQMKFERG